MEYDMPVSSRWAQLIFQRKKTVEGRKNNPNSWGRLKPGDILNIIDETTKEKMSFIIKDIRKYKNIEDYLLKEGLEKTLPGIKSIKDGMKIYLEDCKWTIEEINRFGIIGIEI